MSPNLTAILRSLKGAPLSCLLALSTTRRPVTARWLCEATGYSPGTVTAALRALRAHEFVTHNRRRSAWQLTRRGEIVFLNPRLDPFAPEESGMGGPAAPPQDTQTDRKIYDGEQELKEAESSLKALRDSDSSSSLSSRDNLERILRACKVIFDEPVHLPRGVEVQAGAALACIAQAYCQRGKLSKPARVVFANLRMHARPAQKYLDDPLRYLPDEFLSAAGLERPPAGEAYRQAYAAWTQDEALDVEVEEPLPEVDPTLEVPMHAQGTVNALRAWEGLLAALRSEVAFSVYRQYLEPLVLLDWDAEARRLRVQAPDETARVYLMENLRTRIQRFLNGSAAGEVRLEIVVMEDFTTDELGDPKGLQDL